jgi:hydrogenase maturation protease
VSARVLIAGVGNVFLGDDGFGPEVARRLAAEPLPEGVCAADYGIRGLHLAYALLELPELLVLVDVLNREAPPGTLFVLEPDLESLPSGDGSPHGMDLPAVFAQVRQMGGALPRLLIVGCVPAELDEHLGLSAPVQAAVDECLALVRERVEHELRTMSPALFTEARS